MPNFCSKIISHCSKPAVSRGFLSLLPHIPTDLVGSRVPGGVRRLQQLLEQSLVSWEHKSMSESGTSTEEQREGNWMVSSAILESLQKLPEKLSKQESEKVYNSIIKSFFKLLFKTLLQCNFKFYLSGTKGWHGRSASPDRFVLLMQVMQAWFISCFCDKEILI